MEKKYTMSRPSLNTEEEDEDISTTWSGKATLSPMPHGNLNMHFWMMATFWHDTNDANLWHTMTLTHIRSTDKNNKETSRHQQYKPKQEQGRTTTTSISTLEPLQSSTMSYPYLPPVDNANFSSNDEYSAASPLPSPNEFSRLLTDPEFQEDINRRFARRPATSSTLHFYQHISENIVHLQQEIERQEEERDYLWEHLFNSRSFVGRIKPVMRQYQRKLALHCHGFSYERWPSTLFHVVPENHQSRESVHLPYQQSSIC